MVLYNYDNGSYTGEFPAGERGIGYSQRFSMPYIGLAGQYRINDFEFNALFKFSDWVPGARDNDEHYMRDLTFREKTTSSRYYGTSIDAGYYVTPNAKVFAEFTYSKYARRLGEGLRLLILTVASPPPLEEMPLGYQIKLYDYSGSAISILSKNHD